MQILCGLQVVFFLFNCQTPAAVSEKLPAEQPVKAENASIRINRTEIVDVLFLFISLAPCCFLYCNSSGHLYRRPEPLRYIIAEAL